MKKNNIKSKWMRSRVFGAALFFVALSIASCKKPEDDLGLNLQPEDELVSSNVVDTVSLIMYTLPEDSLRTDELSNNIVGSYMDPELGLTSASFYTELALDGATSFEEDSISIDSVVLALEYDSYYGNLDAQTFAVYEVTDTIHMDSSYYAKSYIAFDSSSNLVEAGYEIISPEPFTPVVVGSDTLDPQLRLRLDTAWARNIINADESTQLSTDDQFQEFIKGLYVRTETVTQNNEEGALLYIDMEDAATKLTIYYTEEVNGVPTAKEVDFKINDKCARFTKASHNYSAAPVGMQLSDSTLGMKQTYVQALSGLKTVIHFPHIKSLIDSGMIGLNKAELILPVDYYQNSSYYPNDLLQPRTLNDDGDEIILDDQLFGISFGSSGFYDSDKKEYRFVITRFLQQVLADEKPNEMRIVSGAASVTGNRCILSGPNTINRRKPKLIITYSNY